MDSKIYNVQSKHIAVKITEEERINIFEKKIKSSDGREFGLVMEVQDIDNTEEQYTQTVAVAEVVGVGRKVSAIKIGDIVILDYLADVGNENLIEKTDEYKVISISAITEYEEEDIIIDANRRTMHDTPLAEKGEVKEASMVIAYVRDGIIHPSPPYLFCKYETPSEETDDDFAMWSSTLQKPAVVERELLFPHEGCDMPVGSMVMTEESNLFHRKLNGRLFDVLFSTDVFAFFEISEMDVFKL